MSNYFQASGDIPVWHNRAGACKSGDEANRPVKPEPV
jgi:hypothetical protein